ncbi:hypothetical protein [Bacillus cereus]|uniref:hypothetical protein n=1 Tax=Bacillus cereus TaxID=1396 RepID=UPI00397F88FC
MFKSKKRIALFIALIVFITSTLYQAGCVNNDMKVPDKIIEVNNHYIHHEQANEINEKIKSWMGELR